MHIVHLIVSKVAKPVIDQYNADKREHWFKVIVSNAAKYSVYGMSRMALQSALITEEKNTETTALGKDTFQCKIKAMSLQNSKAI